MQKMYTPIRIGLLFSVLAVIMAVYIVNLYIIQIHQPRIAGADQAPHRLITRRSTIAAARGNIYDRNGVLLASGRPSYNIKLDWRQLRGAPDANQSILALIYASMDEGLSYTDTFPVTRGAPFEFLVNMTSVQRNRLNAYLEYHNLNPDIPVSDLLAWMRNHYRIDYTVGILDARLIIGVRYELEVRMIVHTINPYVFSSDVSTSFVSYLEERSLTGVFIENNFVREYHTPHAPHIIGYVGAMTAEEFERYRELDYPMDAIVGKVGVEFAFEHLLHGRQGEEVTRMIDNGTIVSHEVTRAPVPGQHVYLTLDLDLQIVTENALRTQIDLINNEREIANQRREEDEQEDLIPGGAVVVTNVNTGEILAAASFPTFNPARLSEDWSTLSNDPNNPMLNRATHGRYTPGSTYKMVTALAALRHINQVTRYYPIEDTGRFDAFEGEGWVAFCWVYRRFGYGHGWVDIVQALECSCNFYFLSVSDWFPGGRLEGARIMAATAQEFGLGVSTGIEVTENIGQLATPEVKHELFERGIVDYPTWFAADTLLAGFGQGLNRFTPVQLANYAATIANGGTLYSMSILQRVAYSDFSGFPHMHTPVVLNVMEDIENIEIIQEGMIAASRGRRGTARPVFGDYEVLVASKTGTVQIEGRAINDGVFVCYAPANNPEIAISIVVEKGGSGSAIMAIARMIFDHYFMMEGTFLVQPYGSMIP